MYLIFIVMSLVAKESSAQQPYLGFHAGASDARGPYTEKEVAASAGGRAGFIFYDHIGLGAFTHFYKATGFREQTAYVPLLAEVLFYPRRTPNDRIQYYVSGLFGTTHLIVSDVTGKRSDNATTLGWTVGYSLFLKPQFNIGPEIQYFYVFGDDNFTFWSAQISFKILF